MADKKVFYTRTEINAAYKLLSNAKALSNKGKKNDAENAYKHLLQQYPAYSAARRALGGLYIEQKQFYLAFEQLSVALGEDNIDYHALLNLEALALELDMFKTGISLAKDIERVGARMGLKEHASIHYYNKGSLFLKTNNYKEAAIALEKCLKANPYSTSTALNLIKCYKDTANYKAGLELIEKFLANTKIKPNPFLYVLSDFPTQYIQKNIQHYISLITNITPDSEERIGWLFSTARLYHVDGKYAEAWGNLKEANELVKSSTEGQYESSSQWEKDILSWAKNTEFKTNSTNNNPSSTLPLYILGPSRSGKTSLEDALTWIPGLIKGYESKAFSDSTHEAFNVGDRLPSDYLPFLPDELIPEFVNFYRSAFFENANRAKIYTTTTPGLISNVPAVLSALPNAKFIFIKRKPIDIALRMYFTHYSGTHYYSYDIKWCLNYITWYYKLTDIWQKKFPTSILTINYEALVLNPQKQMKMILNFIGVSANPEKDVKFPDDTNFSKPYQSLIQK